MLIPETIEEAAAELARVKQANSSILESLKKSPVMQNAWQWAGPEALAGLAGAGVGGVLGGLGSDKKKRRGNMVTGALAGAGLGAGGMLAARAYGAGPGETTMGTTLLDTFGAGDAKARALRDAALKAREDASSALPGVVNTAVNTVGSIPGAASASAGIGAAAAADAGLVGRSWWQRVMNPSKPLTDTHALTHGAHKALNEPGGMQPFTSAPVATPGGGTSTLPLDKDKAEKFLKHLANVDAETPGAAARILSDAQQGKNYKYTVSPEFKHTFTEPQVQALRANAGESIGHVLGSENLRSLVDEQLLPRQAAERLQALLADKTANPVVTQMLQSSIETGAPLNLSRLPALTVNGKNLGPLFGTLDPATLQIMADHGRGAKFFDKLREAKLEDWFGNADMAAKARAELSQYSTDKARDFLNSINPSSANAGNIHQTALPSWRSAAEVLEATPHQLRQLQNAGTQTGTWAGVGSSPPAAGSSPWRRALNVASDLPDKLQNTFKPSTAGTPRSTWGSGLRRAGGYGAAGIGAMALEWLLRKRTAEQAGAKYLATVREALAKAKNK